MDRRLIAIVITVIAMVFASIFVKEKPSVVEMPKTYELTSALNTIEAKDIQLLDKKRTHVTQTALEPKIDPVIPVMVGGRDDWLKAVGIAESDWGYVDYIVGHEAGWDGVTKWNYSGSGAYGICQSLPATKMASAGADYMTNGETQLRWCNSYAIGRYGSWANAYNFWINNNWW